MNFFDHLSALATLYCLSPLTEVAAASEQQRDQLS